MDIIDKLLDLQKQATLERSHYYVASCITEAIQEIKSLRVHIASKPVIEADAIFDPACCKCGDPLTTEELICDACSTA